MPHNTKSKHSVIDAIKLQINSLVTSMRCILYICIFLILLSASLYVSKRGAY